MFDKEMPEEGEMVEEKGSGMRSKLLKELIEMLMQMPDEKKASMEVEVEAEPKEMA
jgi:hypothetical protein